MALLQAILLLGSFGCVYAAKEVCTQEAVADIVFLVDGSWSIGIDNFQQVKDFLHTLVNGFSVGPDQVHIGLAQYSNDPKTEFLLNTYEDKEEILDYIKALPYKGGGTMTGLGLDFILKEQFTEEAGSRAREGVPQIAVVITDGRSQDDVEPHADDLRRRGIVLYAIGIKDADIEELRKIGNEPHNQHVYNVSDFSALQGISQNIVKVLCTTVEETRRQITQASLELADIFFLVDSSTNQQHFKMIRSVLIYLANQLNVNIDSNRMGLAQFGDDVKVEFLLNGYNTKEEVLRHLKSFQLSPNAGGSRKIGAAMDYARNLLTPEAGVRLYPGFRQYLVLMVSGRSDDSVYRQSQLLRDQGINVITVGYGSADHMEMQIMASYSSMSMTMGGNMAHVANELKTIFESKDTHSIEDECDSATVADIVFILDQASSTAVDNLNIIRNFLYRTVAGFDISSNKVRVGVVLYSDTPKAEMYLDTYGNKQDILHHIRRFAFSGGAITNTGEALQFAKDYVFSTKRGSRYRYGVEQFAVVLTGGSSADDVSLAAMELRQSGVRVFTVGVENANILELQHIASHPPQRFVFTAEDFAKLSTIHRNLRTSVCHEINRARKVIHRTRSKTATKVIDTATTFTIGRSGQSELDLEFDRTQTSIPTQACSDMKADVLLLVESSSLISTSDFEKIKTFLGSLLNHPLVGPDALRLGLVQYGSKQEVVFHLNSPYRKDELLEQIGTMPNLGGLTETGKALRYVSRFFDVSKGGRAAVPHILVLLSEGKSQDDAEEAAGLLKQQGVIIYTIGIGSTNSQQMSRIGGGMNNFLKDFDGLLALPEKVMFDICNLEGCQIDMADIIFLVDGSQGVTSEQFDSVKHLMSRLVNISSVGGNHVQMGAIVYATEAQIQFALNKYNTRNELRQAISQLRTLGGDAYTSRALGYSLEYFSARHGSRKQDQVHKVLVVITSEETRDVGHLAEISAKLHKNRVSVFGVGVKGDRNTQLPNQLLTMTNKQQRVFYVDDYNGLESLDRKISQAICDANQAVCKMDLVILVDGSESIVSSNFLLMKNFMTDIVKFFNISPGFLQVGVGQFSTHQQKEFYLNEHTSSEAIIKAIKNIRQLREGTKIVPALKFIKAFFKTQHGSRRDAGVRQILLLITDGETDEDVEAAADDLRDSRVDVFVIGVGRVQTDQLLKIAGSKNRFLPINAYEELKKMLAVLVGTFCPESDDPDLPPTPAPPTVECNVNIAIGFDYASRPTLTGPTEPSVLHGQLLKIINKISTLDHICCMPNNTVKTKIFFSLSTEDRLIPYDGAAVVKKVADGVLQRNTVFNTQFLQSFQAGLRNSAAKVKVAIIISDGLDESVEKLEVESDRLRRSGVSALLMVAFGKSQDVHKLQMVEFGRSFGYKKPYFLSTHHLEDALKKDIEKVTLRECCGVMCMCYGEEGMRGPRGKLGTKGIQGPKGYAGYPGEDGIHGERGAPGQTGPQGMQGCPGDRGSKGTHGYNGEAGEVGEDALNGVIGEQGDTGVNGSPGGRGETGSPGCPGNKGEPGMKGPPGVKGATGDPGKDSVVAGEKGEPGSRGQQGEAGLNGEPGTPGDSGHRGPPGKTGAHGTKGLPGASGDVGPPGSAGFPGSPGSQGPIGQPGQIGLPGPPGLEGPRGIQGAKGLRGSLGQSGKKGQPGDSGLKGDIGSIGPRGPPGAVGEYGYGSPGLKGRKGERGFPGYHGLQGENGSKGGTGSPGNKGARGRGGNPGNRGPPGEPGDKGRSGRRGPRGEPGPKPKSECELVNYVRDNCACGIGQKECPAYPTELVIALDMSEDVTPQVFENMRAVAKNLLEDVAIAESNCPRGARVAIMSFSSSVKYLIRFSDFRLKKLLLTEVDNIALERTSNARNTGAAMRFVARHVFKRTRKGLMMRKVAIFITNGASQDVKSINTGILELKANDIHTAVVGFRNVPNIISAFEADETRSFLVKLMRTDQDVRPQLSDVKKCLICYDPCKTQSSCANMNKTPAPVQVDLDLAVLMDGGAGQYAGVKELLGSLVEQIAVSSQPSRSDNQARVALYQTSSSFAPTGGQLPVQQEFDFVRYQNSDAMKSHIFQSMQQLGGSSGLGYALEWIITRGLLTAAKPRQNKMVLVVVGGETSYWDRARLEYASRLARCQGVVVFPLTVGDQFNSTQVEELASLPLEQHLVHLGDVKQAEQDYAKRFMQIFLQFVKRQVNTYPASTEQWTCRDFQQQIDEGLTSVLEESIPLATAPSYHHPAAPPVPTAPTYHQPAAPPVPNTPTYHQPAAPPTSDQTEDSHIEVYYGTGHDGEYYSGRGDTNEFDVIQLTENDSTLQAVACTLKHDQGRCRDFVVKWHYDATQRRCFPFWYGGCGGNGNRFDSQEECQARCVWTP